MPDHRTLRLLLLTFLVALGVQARPQAPKNIRIKMKIETYDYSLSGLGAPRAGYENCNRAIEIFEKKLEKRGLMPTEKTTCISVDNNLDTYSPSFKVVSTSDLKADLVLGSRFSSYSYCEIERSRMIGRLEKTTSVLESSCRRISVANPENKEAEAFQPAIVVLNTINRDSAASQAAVE